MRRRVLVATWGSHGDVNPHLALVLGLRDAGHSVRAAAPPPFAEAVRSHGLPFPPLRPDVPTAAANPDLLPLAGEADLVVARFPAFAPVERHDIPCVSTALQPSALASADDPPVGEAAPGSPLIQRPSPPPVRPFLGLFARTSDPWFGPRHRFCNRLGPRPRRSPLMRGTDSPYLVLAMSSPVFARPQPDRPPGAVGTGSPFDERGDGVALPPLEAFRVAGESPIGLTLRSSAASAFGRDSEECAGAVPALGRREVLLTRTGVRATAIQSARGRFLAEWAGHRPLFPRAAIVHQGGIGTTAGAFWAGPPALVVPFAHDRPDNARPVESGGIGRRLPARRDTPARVAALLASWREDPDVQSRVANVAAKVAAERGQERADDGIEAGLDGR